MTGYSVDIYDCAGLYESLECETFANAVKLYREAKEKYRGKDKVVLVSNLDRADGAWDGLTDEECEVLGDQ